MSNKGWEPSKIINMFPYKQNSCNHYDAHQIFLDLAIFAHGIKLSALMFLIFT